MEALVTSVGKAKFPGELLQTAHTWGALATAQSIWHKASMGTMLW